MANTMKVLQTTTVGSGGASSISFTNIPQTYTDLIVKISGRSSSPTGVDLGVALNGSTTDYRSTLLYGTGASAVSTSQFGEVLLSWAGGPITPSAATASVFNNNEINIPNYTSANFKSLSGDGVNEDNVATPVYMFSSASLWSQKDPITSITLTPSASGNFVQYSTATLYGVFNADVSAAPATPTIGTASLGSSGGFIDVAFTTVANAASYTVTSTPSSITATGATTPVQIYTGSGGLTAGTSYTFTVKANNPFGSSGASAASNSVTANNTTLVAFGNTSTASVYSNNKGATWTPFTSPAALNMQPMGNGAGGLYGQGRFVMTPYNTNNFYHSTSGTSWTSAALPYSAFGTAQSTYTPGYGFQTHSMYDSGKTVKSTDGINWTASTSIGSVAFAQGYVPSKGRWYYNDHNNPVGYHSTTWGGAWTTNTVMSTSPYFGSSGMSATNGVTAIHVGNYFRTTDLWSTTDGISISVSVLPTGGNIGSQCYGKEINTFVYMGGSTLSATSTNGTSWTTRTTPSSLGANSHCYYSRDTGFVAIPWQGGGNAAYSADGITWTAGAVLGINPHSTAIGQVINNSKTTT